MNEFSPKKRTRYVSKFKCDMFINGSISSNGTIIAARQHFIVLSIGSMNTMSPCLKGEFGSGFPSFDVAKLGEAV